LVRRDLTKDVSEIFSGTVEVDETYLEGQWRNKRKVVRDQGTKRRNGTKKEPVFGILCRNGLVWAEVADDVEDAMLQSLITKQVSPGSVICFNTWRGCTGIAPGDLFTVW